MSDVKLLKAVAIVGALVIGAAVVVVRTGGDSGIFGADRDADSAVVEAEPARLFEPEVPRKQRERDRFVRDKVIVSFDRGVSEADKARVRADVGVRLVRRLPIPGTEVVSFKGDRNVRDIRRSFEDHAEVAYSEPDVIYDISSLPVPNDPEFNGLWGLNNAGNTDMDAPEAWSVATGSSAVTVAVVDSGVAWTHPDLASNVWSNQGESGGGRESNGRDDDGNGFVDDVRGWDWVDYDNDPVDPHGHGTHVAGSIGAVGNNGVGITGVNWSVGIVPLRVLDAQGAGTSSDIASAISYAGKMGVDVVNLSLGGPSYSQTVRDAINRYPNTLVVAAAGNETADNDQVATYPCNYQLANIVCVAAVNQSDSLGSFSNYGASTVHLGAPGESILSTLPLTNSTGYGRYSGTSMAAPHASGAAALLAAAERGIGASEIRKALLNGVVPIPALQGRTTTGGRLSLSGSLNVLGITTPDAAPAPAATPPAVGLASPSPTSAVEVEQLVPVETPGQLASGEPEPTPPAPLPSGELPEPNAGATPSAAPVTPEQTGEERVVTLKLVRHLVAKVTVTNAVDPRVCQIGARVVIKRNGVKVGRGTTFGAGNVSIRLKDRAGRYAVVVPATGGCARAVDKARHGHGPSAGRETSGSDEEIGATCWEPLPGEQQLRTLHNDERLQEGLGSLRMDGELSSLARDHALRMMEKGAIYHRDDLAFGVTEWSILGENVGYASSVESVEEAFMDSPPHRQNVLTRGFTHVGIGLVEDADRVWVTVIFKGTSGTSSAPRLPIC